MTPPQPLPLFPLPHLVVVAPVSEGAHSVDVEGVLPHAHRVHPLLFLRDLRIISSMGPRSSGKKQNKKKVSGHVASERGREHDETQDDAFCVRKRREKQIRRGAGTRIIHYKKADRRKPSARALGRRGCREQQGAYPRTPPCPPCAPSDHKAWAHSTITFHVVNMFAHGLNTKPNCFAQLAPFRH